MWKIFKSIGDSRIFDKLKILKAHQLINIGIIVLLIGIPAFVALKGYIIGASGDQEQFMWQSKNFVNIFINGTTLVNDSSFGIDIPYAYTPLAIVQSILYLTLKAIFTNTTLAVNLTTGIFLTLNYLSMYIFLKSLKLKPIVSTLGAVIFAFATQIIIHANYHISLYIMFTVPLFFMFLKKAETSFSFKNITILMLLLATTFYIHEYHGFFLLVTFFVWICFNYRLFIKKTNLIAFIKASLIGVVSMSLFIKIYVDKLFYDTANNISSLRIPEQTINYNATLWDFLLPSNDNILFGNLASQIYTNKSPIERGLIEFPNYLGIVVLILLFIGIVLWYKKKIEVRNKTTLFYLLILIIGIVFSSGALYIGTNGTIRLPVFWGFNFNIPPINQLRAFGRFGIYVAFIATTASMFILNYIFINLKSSLARSVFPLIIVILAVFSIFDLYPESKILYHKWPIGSFVDTIKNDNEFFYVLNFPFRIGQPDYGSYPLYLQTLHQKNIINSYTSFTSPLYLNKIKSSEINCLYIDTIINRPCDKIDYTQLQNEKVKYIIISKNSVYENDSNYKSIVNSLKEKFVIIYESEDVVAIRTY